MTKQLIETYNKIRENDNGELDNKFIELLEATVGSDDDVWDNDEFEYIIDYFEEFILPELVKETA
jgi:hypothetical protein